LKTFGAVSKETVIQMAEHVADMMQTNYAIAVSGIMGPGGGTDEKPVGTVWIAVTNTKKTVTQQLNLHYERERNMQVTATNALLTALQFIRQDDDEGNLKKQDETSLKTRFSKLMHRFLHFITNFDN
jgi:nicotinamide-nucleotide amidase